jgi:uncharacterized membrane protein YhaH (DUF805 family)
MLLNNIYNLFFKRFLTFKGRSSRKEYIARFLLTIFILLLGAYTIDQCVNASLFVVLYVLGMAVLIDILIFQYFPLSVRRLHDLNESGWYVLLTFVPFCQFFILWLMFRKGTEGANKYGEPPTY